MKNLQIQIDFIKFCNIFILLLYHNYFSVRHEAENRSIKVFCKIGSIP